MALPDFSMRQLLEAGVHFGHQSHRWNPKMAPFIFGTRNNIHIIDLAQTVPLLSRALQAIADTVAKGGRILFVGTKRQASEGIADAAKRCGAVLRQFALARRHADQLEDDLQLDRAPEEDRGDAEQRSRRRLHEEGAAHADAREGKARAFARRHPRHGRGSGPAVRDRHQQGRHRDQGGQAPRHSGRGHRRHQFQSGRHHVPDPGQRRRRARDRALLRSGRQRRDRRHLARPGRSRHRYRRGREAAGRGLPAGRRPSGRSSSRCRARMVRPTTSRSCTASARTSRSSSPSSASSTIRRSPRSARRTRPRSATSSACPRAWKAGSRRPRSSPPRPSEPWPRSPRTWSRSCASAPASA